MSLDIRIAVRKHRDSAPAGKLPSSLSANPSARTHRSDNHTSHDALLFAEGAREGQRRCLPLPVITVQRRRPTRLSRSILSGIINHELLSELLFAASTVKKKKKTQALHRKDSDGENLSEAMRAVSFHLCFFFPWLRLGGRYSFAPVQASHSSLFSLLLAHRTIKESRSDNLHVLPPLSLGFLKKNDRFYSRLKWIHRLKYELLQLKRITAQN